MPTEPALEAPQRKIAAEIFAFDVLMQNFDRKSDNPNMLWNGSRILLIDHESAMHAILERDLPALTNLDLDKFYDHVFYRVISPADGNYERLADALKRLTPAKFDEFFDAIPEVWRDAKSLKKVRAHLDFVVEHRQSVCQLIHERLS